MRELRYTLVMILIYSAVICAGTINHSVMITQPQIEEVNGYHIVSHGDAIIIGNVGDPQLPVWGLNLLLPPGEEAVSVAVETGDPVSLGFDYRIQPVQRQYPLNYSGPVVFDPQNPEVYGQDMLFPSDPVANFHTDFYRGHGIVAIALNPVVYNPITGEIVYYPNFTVTVESSPTARAGQAYTQRLKRNSNTVKELTTQIDNPADLARYGSITDNTDEPYFDILLITHAGMIEMWDEYIDWKTKCGYYVAVEAVQDIYATYPGVDNPEKIRNCIIDYYDNYDLSYALLGGDIAICPHRGLYAQGSNNIPADLYFAGLDGTWNDDGDNYWGEPNEADLRAEIGVSRASVESQAEIDNFVNKQMMFMREPVVDEVETALMVGEDLGWSIWAWEYKEEVRTGNSSWGFYTEPFPPNFEVRTLYEVPGYSFSGMNDLRPLMNQGPIYINHLGHANNDYMMKLYDYQVTTTNFTNNGINHNFYLVFSQGCYCGAFDNSSSNPDCITEIFSTLPTGPVVMVTNSRYGYGNLTTTQGSSQYYDKQFFDALWGEDLTIISEILNDSKNDCIPYISYSQNRYCYYEINLFSEPTLDMWTAEPQELVPGYAASIFLGANSFQVTVPGIDSAKVCLSLDGTIHGLGYTNASGVCNMIISEPLLTLGTADLYVTAHDYIPHEGEVLIIPPVGPYVIFNSLEVDDQQGNANSVWDYGETTYIDMTLENVGVAAVNDVTAEIFTVDPLVTIIDNTAEFGDMAQGATSTADNAYTVMVDGSVEDGHFIAFTLTATGDTASWDSYFSIPVSAPDIVFSELEIDDSGGNGNGNLDPGEDATLHVTVMNEGGCYSTLLQTAMTCVDPYVTINTGSVAYGTIQPGAEATGEYDISVALNCPQEHSLDFNLNFTDDIGYTDSDDFTTIVGDITYMPTGPDNYGYSAYDPNDSPEFPEYEWVEICADSGGPGTLVPFVNDDQLLYYGLPFDFQYYGLVYDSITVSTNGFICMGITEIDDYSNSGIPNSDGPPAMVAPYWEDMSPQRTNSGGVWQWYDASNHLYIVEFNHVEQFAPTGNFETFQTIFYDPVHHPTATGDGRILFQYKDMSNIAQDEGTIGIENHLQDDGIEYLYDGDYDIHAHVIENEMAVIVSTILDAPSLAVSLDPVNPPIIIPSGGGAFESDLSIENTGLNVALFDCWFEAVLPGGTIYGPIILRDNISLIPGAVILRDLTQNVPGNAPAGDYIYRCNVGVHPSTVYNSDEFGFSKTGVDASYSGLGWILTGWEEDGNALAESVPGEYHLAQNYPNPFNPITTIDYALPEASEIELVVFDILGRETITLVKGMQSAGYKSVHLDGSNLSSGIYFYRLKAGDFTEMKKMVLVK